MNPVRIILAFLAASVGLVVSAPVVVMALPFWIVSLLTRGVCRLLEPRAVPLGSLIEYDPDLGWKAKSNVSAYVLDENDDAYLISTDASGWRGRGRTSLGESDVVVIGDSFAFGCAIDDNEFFADVGRDVRVKAVGAPGYSMVQMLLLSRRLAARLRGKLVVWLIYPGNDLDDNLRPEMGGYRTPFLRSLDGTGAWAIEEGHVSSARWPFPSRRHAHEALVEICTPSFLSGRVYSACEHLIEQGKEACSAAGARLVVMTVPELSPLSRRRIAATLAERTDNSGYDADLPDKKLTDICDRLGVPFVALKDHLGPDDYREHDIHWNADGHRRVYSVLREVYRAHAVRDETAAAGLAAVNAGRTVPRGD